MSETKTNISFAGSIPKIYDEGLGPVFFEPYAIDMTERVAKLKPTALLETAAGTGRVTNHLKNKLGAEGKLTATDLNPDMLQVAKDKITDKNISWQQADATELPFADNSFDAVVTCFGIMFYPDKLKGMQEAFRVLKPGGTYLFNVWDKVEHNPMAKTAREIIMGFFENDPPAFYNIPFGYNDPAEITSLLKQAGFKNVSFEMVKKDGVAESVEELSRGLVEGNPIANAIKERDPAALEKIRKKVSNAIAEKFGNAPCKAALQAIVFTGEK